MDRMITVTFEGMEELIAALDTEGIQAAFHRAAMDTGAKVKADASADAPRDLGILAGGIDFDVLDESFEPIEIDAVIYSPEVYAAVMELGRRPGEGKMPPPDMLRGWASRHFTEWDSLTPSQQDSSLFGLALSIWADGIEPHAFLGPALDTNAQYAAESLEREMMSELGWL